MKKFILCVLCFLSFTIRIFASSNAYVVMDADSGRVLGGENINSKSLIASTTKIMTAIVALENSELDQLITVGDEVLKMYGSMIYIDVGEELTVRDLLYGLMLQSGNDAAETLANNILGYDNFIKEMNKKAVELGMKNTIFKNPSGLDEDTQNYSTAYDMSLLMKYAIKSTEFLQITGTKKYKVKTNVETHIWYNKNKLLNLYKNAIGGKIGYTTKSGHVFVSASNKGKKHLVITTIKDNDQFNNHKSLYEKYFEIYDRYKILDKYTFSISDKKFKDYYLYIKNDFYMLLKHDELDKIKITVNLLNTIDCESDCYIGTVNIILDDSLIHSEKIYGVSKKQKLEKVKNWLFFWK